MPDIRYRCRNSECSRAQEFLPAREVVRIEAFGGALYHAYDRQGTLLDPVDGRPNVVRMGSPEAETFPLPCGPVRAITGPCRIRLRRTKGWRKPAGAVTVARPSRYGNPYVVGDELEVRYCTAQRGSVLLYESGRTLYGDMPVQSVITPEVAVMLYRADLELALKRPAWKNVHPDDLAEWQDRVDAVEALRGHDLACWCRLDDVCHADVLLEIANA